MDINDPELVRLDPIWINPSSPYKGLVFTRGFFSYSERVGVDAMNPKLSSRCKKAKD